jgi:uncharacterized membrane protein
LLGAKNFAVLEISSAPILIMSFAAGLLFSSSFYFYFKALFHKNDVSLLQILWNLTVIAVPVLSFVFLRETLPFVSYVGMAVVLLGATLLSFDGDLRKNFSKKYFIIMLGAVLFLSAAMILQESAYDQLNGLYENESFWLGFFFFSLGSFTTGLTFAVFSKRNPWHLIKKFYKIFILGEGIYFLGNMASQKALDVAPNASFVAVIETFVPVFVLAYSLLILFCFKLTKKKNEIVTQIYSEQTGGIWLKVLATIIMAVGVYIMD